MNDGSDGTFGGRLAVPETAGGMTAAAAACVAGGRAGYRMNDGRDGTFGGRLAVPETAGRMTAAAAAWLAALTETQREKACYAFGDERRDWSFLPARARGGLPIGALDDGQRKLAHELIAAGTSLPGYAKVVSVMAMEHVLRALTPATACSSSTTTPRAT